MTADVFVTAVRTGGPGAKGISMLVVERCDELQTNLIKTTYSTAAGTSLVLYEDVKVPVENLLGKEGQGFKLIMYNFNHERWMIVQVHPSSRCSACLPKPHFAHPPTLAFRCITEPPWSRSRRDR